MPIAARVYRPAQARGPALLIFPGVHGGGVDEPRLVSLARQLAAAGGTVITVPLPDLRAYRITVRSVDMIEDAILWGRAYDLAPGGRIGVAESASPAAWRLSPRAVLASSDRPHRCVRARRARRSAARDSLSLRRRRAGHACRRRTTTASCSFSARRSHTWCPLSRSPALDHALVTFLDASSAEAMAPARARQLFEAARAEEAALPEPSRTLMRAVNDARRARRWAGHLRAFAEEVGGAPELSPARSPATRAPVFLLHGTADSVIPSTESLALQELPHGSRQPAASRCC